MNEIIEKIYTFTTDCIDTMHASKQNFVFASAFANDYSYSAYPELTEEERKAVLKEVDKMLKEDY